MKTRTFSGIWTVVLASFAYSRYYIIIKSQGKNQPRLWKTGYRTSTTYYGTKKIYFVGSEEVDACNFMFAHTFATTYNDLAVE